MTIFTHFLQLAQNCLDVLDIAGFKVLKNTIYAGTGVYYT